MDNQRMVREFHQAFNGEEPTLGELIELRRKLIAEESTEVDEALFDLGMDDSFDNYVHLAKELSDLLVVVYGTADKLDIPLDVVFDLVHESNMSKLGADGKPIFREDGKILKGPNYKEPEKEIAKLMKYYWS